jgi:hypothetical protein
VLRSRDGNRSLAADLPDPFSVTDAAKTGFVRAVISDLCAVDCAPLGVGHAIPDSPFANDDVVKS